MTQRIQPWWDNLSNKIFHTFKTVKRKFGNPPMGIVGVFWWKKGVHEAAMEKFGKKRIETTGGGGRRRDRGQQKDIHIRRNEKDSWEAGAWSKNTKRSEKTAPSWVGPGLTCL